MAEISNIRSPWQRLIAAIVFRAIKDYFDAKDVETFLSAYNFLYSGGGVYDHFVDYDIKEIWKLAKEEHERNSLHSD